MKKDLRPTASAINLPERIDQLSAKRQEIIRPILEHPREYVLLSVRAMARRLSTDPATIVRIVRGLGFVNYRAFQHHLHELSLAFATSLDTLQAADHNHDMPAFVRDSLDRDLKNLQGIKNSLDAKRLAALAKRFYEARRIVILAGDLASVLAEFLDYHLTILGLPVFTATSAGRITHLARSINKRDIVVAITFRRGLRQTVEGTQQARIHGAYCVGLTDTHLSPLARECHEVFIASIESTSFGASFCAPIALLDAVLAACAQYKRPHTLAVAKESSEEQRKGFRWYNT
jgi:RpiR family transcriptional regulator, carbohydrate utilization regulator